MPSVAPVTTAMKGKHQWGKRDLRLPQQCCWGCEAVGVVPDVHSFIHSLYIPFIHLQVRYPGCGNFVSTALLPNTSAFICPTCSNLELHCTALHNTPSSSPQRLPFEQHRPCRTENLFHSSLCTTSGPHESHDDTRCCVAQVTCPATGN